MISLKNKWIRLAKAKECLFAARPFLEQGTYVLMPNMRVYCKKQTNPLKTVKNIWDTLFRAEYLEGYSGCSAGKMLIV